MFSENLKKLRVASGMSQEQLALRLNVVRQTVSKWEKGLSVPDADLLVRLAEIFEVSVDELLGETAPKEDASELARISAQLEQINAMLAAKTARNRRIMRIIAVVLLIFSAACFIIAALIEFPGILLPMEDTSVGIIGGADGPTQILISRAAPSAANKLLLAVILLLSAVLLLYRSRREK